MDSEKNVLIIDDDVDLIEAMRMVLEGSHYHVDFAYSPEDGMAVAKAKNPDVIILDVMFGTANDSSGFEYAVKFKQDKKLADIPILMSTSVNQEYSGFNFSKNDEEFLPVDDFVNKPVSADDLVKKVTTLIGQHGSKWRNWPEALEHGTF